MTELTGHARRRRRMMMSKDAEPNDPGVGLLVKNLLVAIGVLRGQGVLETYKRPMKIDGVYQQMWLTTVNEARLQDVFNRARDLCEYVEESARDEEPDAVEDASDERVENTGTGSGPGDRVVDGSEGSEGEGAGPAHGRAADPVCGVSDGAGAPAVPGWNPEGVPGLRIAADRAAQHGGVREAGSG